MTRRHGAAGRQAYRLFPAEREADKPTMLPSFESNGVSPSGAISLKNVDRAGSP
jgi:hypothetical protein